MDLEIAQRPLLPPEDQKRAEHQALRTRLLSGRWENDLEVALSKHIRSERRSVWGIGEMSRNPFRSLATQVGGALYQCAPTVRGPAGGDALIKAVEDAGFWQLQQRWSTDLVGLREGIVRVDWDERGGLLYRSVPCELAVVRALHSAPDVPVAIEEVQARVDPATGKPVWAWEILDISNLDNPVQKILSGNRKHDWTGKFFNGPRSGADYQFRDPTTNAPYLPATMYHAERTGRLWDSWYGVEAVLGTLTIGVLLTFWVHGVKDGSFATVLLAGGKVLGLEVENPGTGERTNVISTEPGSIIEVGPADDGITNIQAIQLQPGMDPEKLMRAIGMFESGLAEYAGVSPADLVRTGADPRSGASLAISREGLRGAQGRYEPQLRRGDSEILSISAKVLNSATRTAHPTSGYTLSYPSLPFSTDEIRAQREDLLEKIDHGLMSKVDAYRRLHPGLTRDQAIADLQRIQRDNAMFGGVRGAL